MANDAKLNAVVTLSDRFSKPLADMNKKLRGFQAPMQKFSNQLRQLDRNSGFNKVRAGIGGVGKQMAYLGGAAAGVVASVVYLTGRVAKSGDGFAKTARAIGISGEALQEWTYVAERFGIEQSGLNTSMEQFSKRLGEAKAGTGSMVTLLKKVNPEFLAQLTATESLDEALDLYLDAIRKIDDPTRQAALANAAFGRSGIAMTNIARGSKDEINALRQELRDLGGIMGGDALADAEAYQDSMTKMSSIMTNFQIVLGAKLMPKITALMERFAAWYLANKELINQRLDHYIVKLSDSFSRFLKWVETSGPGISKFIDKIGGFKTVVIGIAAVIAGPLLAALATLSAALLTTPVGWVLIGIAGAIGSIAWAAKKLGIEWGPVFEWYMKWWGDIFDTIKSIYDMLVEINKIKITDVFGNNSAEGNGGERGGQVTDDDASPLALASSIGSAKKGRSGINRRPENQVSGRISVEIDSSGQPKIKEVVSNNRNIMLDANVGMSGVGG